MQAIFKDIAHEVAPDHARIKRLVEAAAEKHGGFRQLAEVLKVHPQLISNWRNGVKTPSPEAQAELAVIADQNVLIASLMALIEKSAGDRKSRLQSAYLKWSKEQGKALITNTKNV